MVVDEIEVEEMEEILGGIKVVGVERSGISKEAFIDRLITEEEEVTEVMDRFADKITGDGLSVSEFCKYVERIHDDYDSIKIGFKKCSMCGSKLDYLDEEEEFECMFCEEKVMASIVCSDGHFICHNCWLELRDTYLILLLLGTSLLNYDKLSDESKDKVDDLLTEKAIMM